ncbi:MAG: hypothetical protein J5J00_02725 [Deltaproteobacteria bacterium]|nr:hypothetical protein [Deltaproteobacteria bacterium]
MTLLDVGLGLEPEIQQSVCQLKQSEPALWDRNFVESTEWFRTITPGHLPKRLLFGSNFPYAQAEESIDCPDKSAILNTSYACGGLSNVWGAASLPYTCEDLTDWPLDIGDLAPHYKAIAKLVPFTGMMDPFSSIYPMYAEDYDPIELSEQAAKLLANLERSRQELERQGLVFGASRLMARKDQKGEGAGCIKCGMCLQGCPHDLIFVSSWLLSELAKFDNFSYRPNVKVEEFQEESNLVRVMATAVPSGERLSFTGSKLMLACGTGSTVQIVLRSLNLYGREVQILTNQHFVLPLLSFSNVNAYGNASSLQALCQLFLQLREQGDSTRTVHLQLSSYSKALECGVKNTLRPFYSLFKRFISRHLLGRLLVTQGYLHSSHSPKISAVLQRGERPLRVCGKDIPESRRLIRNSVWRLFLAARQLRALPVFPQLIVSVPGQGSHIGGTFPMKRSPGELQTDRLGRLYGTQNVHIVDASVLPSLPSSPITYSLMANAHRIALEVPSS